MAIHAGKVLERVPAKIARDLQTYTICFPDSRVEIVVTGTHLDGEPIVMRAEHKSCAIHFFKPVFEHDIYWLPANQNVELLPLHNSSPFEVLQPATAVMIVDGKTVEVTRDGPRIPTSG